MLCQIETTDTGVIDMNESMAARTIRNRSTESRIDASLARKGVIENIESVRARARQQIEEGPVTDAYGAERRTVVQLLNSALATELVCMLRYKRHHFMAKGIYAEPVAAEFREHANEEQAHADALAERIVQLGGEPDFSPAGLAQRSHSDYVTGHTLYDMMRENLVAERIAIDCYSQIIRYLADDDPTTRRLLEDILANEEKHADELASMLNGSENPS
jgi:bacterioferritin